MMTVIIAGLGGFVFALVLGIMGVLGVYVDVSEKFDRHMYVVCGFIIAVSMVVGAVGVMGMAFLE